MILVTEYIGHRLATRTAEPLTSFTERKTLLQKVLRRTRGGITHIEGGGAEMFEAVCRAGLEGMVSKKLDSPYRAGKSKAWIKVKNPKAPAATRVLDGTF